METYEVRNHIQESNTGRVKTLLIHNINHTQHININHQHHAKE